MTKTGYRFSKIFKKTAQEKRLAKLIQEDYQIVFEDNFDSFNTNIWHKGQVWGAFNPGTLHQYYDNDAVKVNNGVMELWVYHKPKEFSHNDSIISIPYGTGLVNTDRSFTPKFGYFEARVKLPIAQAIWPAFWLTGKKSWPPEIDIFENYGGEDGSEINVQSHTIHFGVNGEKTRGMIARKTKIAPKGDTAFHIYACHWTSEFIAFYTDGKLIRKQKMSKNLAFWMNREMSIVLNNGLESKYLPENPKSYLPNKMEIDWIRVYQKKADKR